MIVVAWGFLILSVLGFLVTFPMWLLGVLDVRMMIGITLALSWAALWYAAAMFLDNVKEMHKVLELLEEHVVPND